LGQKAGEDRKRKAGRKVTWDRERPREKRRKSLLARYLWHSLFARPFFPLGNQQDAKKVRHWLLLLALQKPV
jgi:hypothetical protein